MVRPIIEYVSEIWCGQVPAYLVDEAEAMQLKFLKGTLGLHFMGGGISSEVTGLRRDVKPSPLAGTSCNLVTTAGFSTPSLNGFYGWWQSSDMPSA